MAFLPNFSRILLLSFYCLDLIQYSGHELARNNSYEFLIFCFCCCCFLGCGILNGPPTSWNDWKCEFNKDIMICRGIFGNSCMDNFRNSNSMRTCSVCSRGQARRGRTRTCPGFDEEWSAPSFGSRMLLARLSTSTQFKSRWSKLT